MGHVSPRAFSRTRQSPDFPRRERRGVGKAGAFDLNRRFELGAVGERIAEGFLARHGLRVVGRNIVVDSGEIDLLAMDGDQRVVVEVRTRTGAGDPIDAIPFAKRSHVAALGRRAGASRVDMIGVRLADGHADIHWVPDAL